jgi:hypothetical protein
MLRWKAPACKVATVFQYVHTERNAMKCLKKGFSPLNLSVSDARIRAYNDALTLSLANRAIHWRYRNAWDKHDDRIKSELSNPT